MSQQIACKGHQGQAKSWFTRPPLNEQRVRGGESCSGHSSLCQQKLQFGVLRGPVGDKAILFCAETVGLCQKLTTRLVVKEDLALSAQTNYSSVESVQSKLQTLLS